MNNAGPTASPTLLVPNLCTLNKTIRDATVIITDSPARVLHNYVSMYKQTKNIEDKIYFQI